MTRASQLGYISRETRTCLNTIMNSCQRNRRVEVTTVRSPIRHKSVYIFALYMGFHCQQHFQNILYVLKDSPVLFSAMFQCAARPIHYGRFPYRQAAKNNVAILCHMYKLYNTNLKFWIQKTSLRDKLLKRAYSEIMSFDTNIHKGHLCDKRCKTHYKYQNSHNYNFMNHIAMFNYLLKKIQLLSKKYG